MYIFLLYFFSKLRSATFVYHSCHLRLSTAFREVLWPTQSPIQWIPDPLSLGESDRGVQLTTYPYLVTTLRISGAIPLLLYMPTYICIHLHSNSWYSVPYDRKLSLCFSVPPQAKGPDTLWTTRVTYLQVNSLESDNCKEQNYFKRESELFNLIVWLYYRCW